MITREQIEQLGAFDGQGARVLSVYLDLDPRRQIRRAYRIVFEDLVKEAREGLQKPALEELLREADRVQSWLMGQEPRGTGLAVFSCAPRDLWQPLFLRARVSDHLAFEPMPDVAPLLEILDEYERYAVALVDKERARLFTVFMGEIEESDVFKDFVPGKHDQGSLSQARHQRHQEAHVHWHLKRVAGRLAELLGRRRFDRLIIAGPEEATSDLRRLLPRALAARVAAVLPAETTMSDRDLLGMTLEVERRIEREAEGRILRELFELARGGGRAVIGLAPTLQALWLGEVQTLVASEEARAAGSECASCGRLEPGEIAKCPADGAAMRPVHDLIHRAMGRAVDMSGSVEVLRGDAGRRLLEEGAGLGALLRYKAAG